MPGASVNVDTATSIVDAPSAVGVNVAVYTVLELAVKELRAPLLKVISLSAKLLVASFDVNVSERVPSFEVSPSLTSLAVIVIVGPVPS